MRYLEVPAETKLVITILRVVKPFEIKGDREIAEMICAITSKQFTTEAVRMRVKRGFYKRGEDFRETGGKMRLWNREAVIAKELQNLRNDGWTI